MTIYTALKETFLDIVYPHVCIFCRHPCQQLPDYPDICRSCLSRLPLRLNAHIDPGSLRLPFYINPELKICCAAHYRAPIRQALIRLKFTDARESVGFFAELLYKRLSKMVTTQAVVVPVPLHKQRLKERGYNQAALIASELAAKMNLLYLENYLMRCRNTARQSEQLNREARFANLHGAFILNKEAACINGIINRQIILVDDVLTTGATLLFAAKPLLTAGHKVTAAVIASNTPETP